MTMLSRLGLDAMTNSILEARDRAKAQGLPYNKYVQDILDTVRYPVSYAELQISIFAICCSLDKRRFDIIPAAIMTELAFHSHVEYGILLVIMDIFCDEGILREDLRLKQQYHLKLTQAQALAYEKKLAEQMVQSSGLKDLFI